MGAGSATRLLQRLRQGPWPGWQQQRGGPAVHCPASRLQAQEEAGFRQHRFTGGDRRLEFAQPCLGPEVEAIPAVEAGHERPSIHEHPFLQALLGHRRG